MEWTQWLSTLPKRLRFLFHRDAAERELNDELRYHMEELIAQHVANGVPLEEARLRAMRAMDGVEQQKELCRDTRGTSRLEHLGQDLRFGARMLRKSPGFTLVAVAALALGIGANTALFSIVYGVLFRPLPYAEPDRVVMVFMRFSGRGVARGTMSMADFFDWRQHNQSFEEPALVGIAGQFDINDGGEAEQVRGGSVSSGFFSALRAEPLIGRTFATGEDRPGSQKLVVLTEGLWRRRYASDPNAVGKSITLNGEPHTIIGVLPGSFRFDRLPTAQLWTNLILTPPTRRGPFFYNGIARLKPGVTLAQAQAELSAIAAEIQRANPGYKQVAFPVVPVRDAVVDNVRTALFVLFGAVFFVLLISIANVANLSLSRAQVREREIALRSALGANRGRIVRQLLTESILLSAIGGAVGLAIAFGALRVLRSLNPGNLPRVGDIRLDPTVLAFTAGVSVLAGILFGLAPALQSSRRGLDAALKQGSRGTVTGRSRIHGALIVTETALSLVLLIGSGLLIRSLNRLQHNEAGFSADPASVIFAPISLSGPRYQDPAAVRAFTERLNESMKRIPGMAAFGLSDSLPPNHGADNDTFVVQGQPWSPTTNPSVDVATVDPGYFRMLGIPILRGRDFADSDTPTSTPVAIVSESWARRYFPDDNPIGHRIKQSGPDLNNTPFMEIVGVVGDVKYEGLQQTSCMAYYMPLRQVPTTTMFMVAHPAIPVSEATAAMRRAVREIDPNVVVNATRTLEDAMSQSVAQPRFRTVLLGTFAGLALLLAAIGIYGVIAYSVAQRSNEIGVRMALGAGRSDVLKMVVNQGLKLVGGGLLIGIMASFGLTRVLRDLLFAVQPTDPITFAAMTGLLLTIALAACLQPAWRASKVDPVIALRHE